MKLSVAMITYNHEKYIAQALNSALEQQVNFDYEIVVSDDCSSDRTPDILRHFKREYPNIIRLLDNPERLGVGRNVRRVYTACQGDYIAFLEGDDYWLYPQKLHKQMQMLTAQPAAALCFHPVQVYSEEEQRVVAVDGNAPSGNVYTLSDLMRQTIFPRTCSVVFRRGFTMPQWMDELNHVDFIMFALAAQQGTICYLDEEMAVYRRHGGGVYSGASRITKITNNINSFGALNQHFDYKYAAHLNLRKYYAMLARELQQVGQPADAKAAFRHYLTLEHGGSIRFPVFISTFIVLYLPWVYTLYRRIRYPHLTP